MKNRALALLLALAAPRANPLPRSGGKLFAPYLQVNRVKALRHIVRPLREGLETGTSLGADALQAAPLHGRRDTHGLAIFGNGAARNVDSGLVQQLDNSIIAQNRVTAFAIDHLTNAMTHGLS